MAVANKLRECWKHLKVISLPFFPPKKSLTKSTLFKNLWVIKRSTVWLTRGY